MNKKILIIGQNGFIGSNLFKFFINKKLRVYSLSFESFINNNKNDINKFDIIINCTSNKKFIENEYQIKNDNDLIIAKKIIHLKPKSRRDHGACSLLLPQPKLSPAIRIIADL